MHPVLVTPPATTPISVADVRGRGRIDAEVPDAMIKAMITAATARLDGWSGLLGRVLVTQTWKVVTGDCRNAVYRLPLGPVKSATVTYVKADGETQTLTDDQVSLKFDAIGAKIMPAKGHSWPSAPFVDEGLTITFVAGDEPEDVPAPIREAIHLYVQNMLDTAFGNGLIRTETVEGVGSTGYFTPDEANAPMVKLADDMVRQYRRGNL
jgi:uncharacterized phiE125 gp8 family phage protein